MVDSYLHHDYPGGIRLILMPTAKFKTTTVVFLIQQELDALIATRGTLLSSVLEQGSRLYPERLLLDRELENLYGADLSSFVYKLGERHIVGFTLQVIDDRFTKKEDGLLGRGLELLAAVIHDPLIVRGGFKEEYVLQQKRQLKKDLDALINSRESYAFERCLSHMCSEERFRFNKLGSIDELIKLDHNNLYHYYHHLMTANPAVMYILGNFNEADITGMVEKSLIVRRKKEVLQLNKTKVEVAVQGRQYREETFPASQARLVIGYRTYTGYADPLSFALIMYSGILGGFSHSKLFLKVREEGGYAYDIGTILERHKGLMFIAAGINASDYPRVKQVIDQQVESMILGKISTEELEHTRKALISQVLSRNDSPGKIIRSHLGGLVGGKIYTVQDFVSGLKAIGIKEIMSVANRVKEDTIYLLKPGERGEQL